MYLSTEHRRMEPIEMDCRYIQSPPGQLGVGVRQDVEAFQVQHAGTRAPEHIAFPLRRCDWRH